MCAAIASSWRGRHGTSAAERAHEGSPCPALAPGISVCRDGHAPLLLHRRSGRCGLNTNSPLDWLPLSSKLDIIQLNVKHLYLFTNAAPVRSQAPEARCVTPRPPLRAVPVLYKCEKDSLSMRAVTYSACCVCSCALRFHGALSRACFACMAIGSVAIKRGQDLSDPSCNMPPFHRGVT